MSKNDPAERAVREIRRKTRKQYSAEEKIRIVVSGRRGEDSIAELCRREGIAESLYYSWSKEFLKAGKKRLSGDGVRAGPSQCRHKPRQRRRTVPLDRPPCGGGAVICAGAGDL